ncbi:hypothetical protein LCGC14_2201110, partial [marine sediment metagenome]
MPPSLNLSVQVASGTSANRLGGGQRISSKALNRKWTFGLDILGDSVAEIARGAADVQGFLDQAGDESSPTYLQYRDNSNVGFEPLWGQFGANYRYEIVSGNIRLPSSYAVANIRGQRLIGATVSLEIKPFALGLQQRVGSATGGILEDTIGTVDGISRGTIIPQTITNKMTNPIFGHATFDNGWTAGSGDIKVTENIDKKFITHGKSSAKLVNTDTVNTEVFTQSIDVGNTNTHHLTCYVKLPDGGVVSSTQVGLRYSGNVSETYTSVGDGWYLLDAAVTGINAGTVTGVAVEGGYTVYVDGFQIAEVTYVVPVTHGDMLGCAWTGTAHASTSTRTVSRLRIATADSFDTAEGTIRVVWKASREHSALLDGAILFRDTDQSFRCYWDQTNDKWVFVDGTNTISSAVDSFSVGDIRIFHFVFEPGSLKTYIAGAQSATGSTYTPPTIGADLYIGSSAVPDTHLEGTFMDFTTFAQAMTAAEALADYTNILEQVEDNRRLSPIPWLWTKDGDDVVDNHDDAGEDNWAVVGGVPGTADAETEWLINPSVNNKSGYWLMTHRADYGQFILPTSQWYKEVQGTAEAGTSEGEFARVNIGSGGWITPGSVLSTTLPEIAHGKLY